MVAGVPEAAVAAGGRRTSAPRPRDAGLTAAVAVVVCVVVVVAAALAWRVGGGRWAVVETPSMGSAVPVGSLVLIEPRPLDSLHVGDVVTYRPPPNGVMFTHRVVALDDRGVRVQGDINGAVDPYPVTGGNLVGKVVAHWQGVGHLVRALPFLLLAQLVLLLLTQRLVGARWRSTIRVLGTCLTVTLCQLFLQPFVRPILLSTVPSGDDLEVRVVSAGMFPTRVLGAPGQHVDLDVGQVGSVVALPSSPGGPGMVVATPHLTGWWLVAVVVVCLLPVLWCLLVGLSPEDEDEDELEPEEVPASAPGLEPEPEPGVEPEPAPGDEEPDLVAELLGAAPAGSGPSPGGPG